MARLRQNDPTDAGLEQLFGTKSLGYNSDDSGTPTKTSQLPKDDSREKTPPRELPLPQLPAPGPGPGGPPPPGGTSFAPPRPQTPSPVAAQPPMPSKSGVMPFEPMGMPSPDVRLANPARGGLYGSLGGLKGGGLGVPLDPINDAASDPISTLIAQLMKQGR